MNKKLRKIIKIIVIIAIFSFFINGNLYAASTTVSASSKTVNSGETFTIDVTSSLGLTGWTISLASNGGCTFVSASGGEVNGTSIFGASLSPTTSLASYTFKAPNVEKDTTYTISFSATGLADEQTNEVNGSSCTATVTVKGTDTGSGSGSESGSNTGSGSSSGSNNNSGSGSNSGSGNSGSSSSSTPSFTEVNETVYATGSVNVRQSWSTSSSVVGSLSEGQSVTRTGKGSNGWSRVTFNGSTAYVSSQYLTTEKPEDKSKNSALKELTLLQGTLTPEFSKDITEYTVQVGTDVTELQLDAIPEDEKAKVTVEGNTDLKDGENKVTITVTAEDESATVYTLTVNKTDETKDVGPVLSKLEISGATLSPTFSPEVYSYSVNVPIGTTTLDITAEAEDEETTVEITGNTDLKEGENLVTIMVTKGEGEEQQVTTYQITVNVGDLLATSGENSSSSSGPNILVIICGIAAAIIVIAIIALIVINRRNKMDYDDDEDEDEDYANTTMLNQNFNYADELKARRAEKAEEKKQSREDYLNSYKDIADNSTTENSNENDDNDDDTTDRKKRRGRHF